MSRKSIAKTLAVLALLGVNTGLFWSQSLEARSHFQRCIWVCLGGGGGGQGCEDWIFTSCGHEGSCYDPDGCAVE